MPDPTDRCEVVSTTHTTSNIEISSGDNWITLSSNRPTTVTHVVNHPEFPDGDMVAEIAASTGPCDVTLIVPTEFLTPTLPEGSPENSAAARAASNKFLGSVLIGRSVTGSEDLRTAFLAGWHAAAYAGVVER